ncbi:MAG: hypothetical protein KKB66_16010 [Alphaproteobacteria bacterium]|nr:hypothetical protein [Alphaproteobacteria bacterium]MBU0804320.1 hypothetical protein [Alphaproteobacteria bacterium]MBU0871151.1 hypothetical protein [Alphaproteobacteria bacterium]MBU1400906.1 hypothetical protein [Alphaproteobacteria bacterium]MBU1592677.1 hypothetical protein [Alphaproteobacteria bacterium]
MTGQFKTDGDIWRGFCSALGAEYRDHKQIQGISGLTHEVQAIAVDDKTKRLILVSAEYNPRIAALMRVDVQATMPDVKVLVARPLAVDLAHTARTVFGDANGNLDATKIVELVSMMAMGDEGKDLVAQTYGPALTPFFNAIGRSQLPILSHILNGIQQAASIDWNKLIATDGPPDPKNYKRFADFFLGEFQTLDNLAEDRRQGICPVPTYQLSDDDWETLRQGNRIDDIQERLKAIGVFQYFFPPKDDLALGLIDRGFNTVELVERGFSVADQQGHQISANTIVPQAADTPELMDSLRMQGLTLEAEFETEELTPDGKKVRTVLRIRPAEGLLEKLSKVVKLDLSLKDIFRS